MTACRMRTIAAGRVLSCVLVIAVALMGGCIVLGYRMARDGASETRTAGDAAAGGSIDLKRTEGRVVIDRIGDLSGRLIRLEIEAAALGRRLGVAPSPGNVGSVGGSPRATSGLAADHCCHLATPHR